MPQRTRFAVPQIIASLSKCKGIMGEFHRLPRLCLDNYRIPDRFARGGLAFCASVFSLRMPEDAIATQFPGSFNFRDC
jgi:hypothetical protein